MELTQHQIELLHELMYHDSMWKGHTLNSLVKKGLISKTGSGKYFVTALGEEKYEEYDRVWVKNT